MTPVVFREFDPATLSAIARCCGFRPAGVVAFVPAEAITPDVLAYVPADVPASAMVLPPPPCRLIICPVRVGADPAAVYYSPSRLLLLGEGFTVAFVFEIAATASAFEALVVAEQPPVETLKPLVDRLERLSAFSPLAASEREGVLRAREALRSGRDILRILIFAGRLEAKYLGISQ